MWYSGEVWIETDYDVLGDQPHVADIYGGMIVKKSIDYFHVCPKMIHRSWYHSTVYNLGN
jgi:hypothetical protein